MWILVVILAELIALSVIFFLIMKHLEKRERKINIEKSVCKGIKSAIKELEEEKQQEDDLMESIKSKESVTGIFSSSDLEEEPINTRDLIPVNLSESEKEILRMFYNQ